MIQNDSEGLDLGSSGNGNSPQYGSFTDTSSTSNLNPASVSNNLSRFSSELKSASPLLIAVVLALLLFSAFNFYKAFRSPEPPKNVIEVAGPKAIPQ